MTNLYNGEDELVQNHVCNECGVERVIDDEDNICHTCYHKSCDEGECYCCYAHEEDDESDEPLLCWNGKPCETDELGCCVVCCECKSCICRLQKEEAKLNEDKVMIIKKKPKKLKIVKSFDN